MSSLLCHHQDVAKMFYFFKQALHRSYFASSLDVPNDQFHKLEGPASPVFNNSQIPRYLPWASVWLLCDPGISGHLSGCSGRRSSSRRRGLCCGQSHGEGARSHVGGQLLICYLPELLCVWTLSCVHHLSQGDEAVVNKQGHELKKPRWILHENIEVLGDVFLFVAELRWKAFHYWRTRKEDNQRCIHPKRLLYYPHLNQSAFWWF